MGGKEDVDVCKMFETWMKIVQTKNYKTRQTFLSQVVFSTFISKLNCCTRIK